MTLSLQPADLLPGETLVQDKAANMLVQPQDHQLRPLFSGQEALGGKLYLTTDRLLFKTHAFNRVTGAYSLFLPSIRSVRDTSRLVTRKIEVTTGWQTTEFVLWGIPEFLAAIERARGAVTAAQVERLRQLAVAGHPALGLSLRASTTVDAALRAVMAGAKLVDLVASPSPGALATLGEVVELVRPQPPRQG